MEDLQNKKATFQGEHLKNEIFLSPYQHHVLSHILPQVDRELGRMQRKNKILEKAIKVVQNRELLRIQLGQCKIQVKAMGRKINSKENALKKERKKNEVIKKDLESLKKELQFVKQQAASQKVEHQTVKDQLEQVMKDKDVLGGRLLNLQYECSDLRLKISSQESKLTRKKNENLEDKRQIQLLRVANQKLEKERSFLVNEVEETKQEVRKFEEQLSEMKKQEKSLRQRFLDKAAARRTAIIQQKSKWKPKRMPPEYLQLMLIKQGKELKRSQKLAEELKKNLKELSLKYKQCKAALKLHKEKLRAAILQRNAFQTEMEHMQCEIMIIQQDKLGDNFKDWVLKRNKMMKMSYGDKSSRCLLCTARYDLQVAASMWEI